MARVGYRYGVAATALAAVAAAVAVPPLRDGAAGPGLRLPGVDLIASIDLLPHPSPSGFDIHPHLGPAGPAAADALQALLGERAADPGELGLTGAVSAPVAELDPAELAAVLGGGFDPAAIRESLAGLPGLVAPGLPSLGLGGALSGLDAQTVAATAGAGTVTLAQALADVQQGVATAVADAELAANWIVVEVQLAAARQLFGDNPAVVDWVVGTHNAALANSESLLDLVLGIGVDPHTVQHSLLADAVSPGEFSTAELAAILQLLQSDSLAALLLSGVDWPDLLFG